MSVETTKIIKAKKIVSESKIKAYENTLESLLAYRKENKLSQQKAAELFGWKQPRISNFEKRHYDKFSLECLAFINEMIK